MSSFQIAYTLALLALSVPAWGRQRYSLVVLWANLAAILAICLAYDLGFVQERFGLFMVVDLASGAALVIRPGLPRVIAIGYALTFPFYIPLIDDLFTGEAAPLTVICAQAALQIGALAIGSMGDNSGGSGRRLPSERSALAASHGDYSLLQGKNSAALGARLKEAGNDA